MSGKLDISIVRRLEDLEKADKPGGYNLFFKENYQFATSDINVAAYLQTCGVRCDGTVVHKFRDPRGREKIKIYMVFNHDPGTVELRERIQHLLREGWGGPEGQNIRLFLTECADLKKMVNDTIDLE